MIYLDNASTSFPKAPGLAEFVKNFIDESCFNVGRGSYRKAQAAAETAFVARENLARMFGAKSGKHVVFTAGATESLNFCLRGLLKKGDRVLAGPMEHNAVYRTLNYLQAQGVTVDYWRGDKNGEPVWEDLAAKLLTKPKLLVTTHASNVCGTVMPIGEIGRLCKENGVIFIVDAAQTAGVLPVDAEKTNIDALCFSGHKGMLSLPGTGVCILSDRAARLCSPLLYGGTGSFSERGEMPPLLPDRFEAGTPALVCIAALNFSTQYIASQGAAIFSREQRLQQRFESGLAAIRAVEIIGKAALRCPVTALNFKNIDNGEAAFRLDEEFGVMVRSGLQCAPLAHKTLGTFPAGVVRFSFGHNNSDADVDAALAALASIAGR